MPYLFPHNVGTMARMEKLLAELRLIFDIEVDEDMLTPQPKLVKNPLFVSKTTSTSRGRCSAGAPVYFEDGGIPCLHHEEGDESESPATESCISTTSSEEILFGPRSLSEEEEVLFGKPASQQVEDID